jgi:hypothetical protein
MMRAIVSSPVRPLIGSRLKPIIAGRRRKNDGIPVAWSPRGGTAQKDRKNPVAGGSKFKNHHAISKACNICPNS